MNEYLTRCALAGALLALAFSVVTAQPREREFGTKRRLAFSFHGTIYFIPDTTTVMPEFASLTPMGTIFTPRLNVPPPHSFEQGFPGVTDRIEWFAIEYIGEFEMRRAETYRFELTSDDGSRLYIDDDLVVDNDGLHGPETATGRVTLHAGRHAIRVQYYQGPRTEVALVLRFAPQNEAWEIFDLEKLGAVEVDRSGGTTRYTLGAQMLFDLDMATLKPGADSTLAEIAGAFMDAPATSRMQIDGYTDDLGTESHNTALSLRRAQAVAAWMTAHGIGRSRLVVAGFGESRPRFPNTSEENRAQNRRVEITVGE